MSDLVVMNGSSHPRLAQEIATRLRVPLGAKTFRDRDVVIVQPATTAVRELAALVSSCRAGGAAQILVVAPYCDAAFAKAVQATGADRLLIVDPHSPRIESICRIPIDTVSAVEPLALALREGLVRRWAVVAPKPDALRLATRYAEIVDGVVAVVSEDGRVVGDVHARPLVVVDDEIRSGATMVRALAALLLAGADPGIVLAATHAPRIDEARARLDVSAVREVLVTDSVPQDHAWPKLRVVSVAPLLAHVIKNVATGFSRSLTPG